MKKLLSVLFALFLIACANPDISGTWVQPIPNMPTMTQGFILNPDGTAKSVNMATLQYDTWTLNGNKLTITGRSIGNGQTIEFSETYILEKLSPDTLVLRNGDMELTYTRQQ